jgi:hypothetical protein
MRYLPLLVLLLAAGQVFALGLIPGPGEQVLAPLDRDYGFAYHDGSDDFRLYGTSIWAVRFDFASAYPSLAEAEFLVDRALLWFPQTGDSVRVELFTDVSGLPGTRLSWITAPVTDNYLELSFPQPSQAGVLWMLVHYTTNFTNRFVSASEGDGSHSFYWNTNAQNPHFQSLATAGFPCELLFGVGGEFILTGADLELAAFDLEGLIAPREDVYPTFTVYNHSDAPVTGASVSLNLYAPLTEYNQSFQIDILETIPPREAYTYGEQSGGYWENRLSLPDVPIQLKFRAALSSPLGADDPQFNNVIITYRYSFTHPYPVYLTENFLRQDFASPLWDVQAQYYPDEIEALNYFPVLSDSLSSPPAAQHFNWYGFNSLPRTVIGGEGRITGYTPSYAGQYQDLAAAAIQEKTFVSSFDCRLNHLPASDAISADITLYNDQTHLFNTATDYNLVSNARFFAGLFKSEQLSGGLHYVLVRWIAHAELPDGNLGFGESLVKSYSFILNNVTLNELAQDYRLYFWLQTNGGAKVLWAGSSDFTSVVSNPGDLAPSPILLAGSNPLRRGGILKLSLSDLSPLGTVEIFNLKGQSVLRLQTDDPELNLADDSFPASGIYFVRVSSSRPAGRTIRATRRITVIK